MSEHNASKVGNTGRRFRVAAAASYGCALYLVCVVIGQIIMQQLQPG